MWPKPSRPCSSAIPARRAQCPISSVSRRGERMRDSKDVRDLPGPRGRWQGDLCRGRISILGAACGRNQPSLHRCGPRLWPHERSRHPMHPTEQPKPLDLRSERDRFLAFAFAAADLLIEASPEGQILFCAGAAQALTGKAPSALLAGTVLDLWMPGDRALLARMLRQAV